MKKILILTAFLASICLSAQSNLFDDNGNRHGSWSKNFDGTNQMRYEGQFEHGKEIGLFKYYKLLKNKSYLTATKLFNENDRTAYVKFLTITKKVISEGMMNGRLYVGEWKYFHKNSSVVMTLEMYNDEGLLNGERNVYYDTGKLAETLNYLNGELQGKSLYYSENGALIKEYIYVDDELHGWSKHFDDITGNILLEGMYKKGKKSGIWKYYTNGKLSKEKNFDYIPKRNRKQ